jgi:RimJ/RimL family protein N-acetyltransferase
MIIGNFGITLSQLTLEDIELVRYWRNSKEISSVMEYQKFITEEEQKKWFNSLNPLSDFYFLINYKGVKVGLIHTSHINWKDKTADAGLFVWDKNYLGTHIPVLASLAMLECFFENFGLKKYFAKVGRENSIAIRYNLTLGFSLHEKSDNSSFDFYVLEKESYLKASEKLKRFASTVSSEKAQLKIAPELLNEIKKLNA